MRRRVKEIRDGLATLREYGNVARLAFVADQKTVNAAKYRLLVVIEAAISIGNHIASRVAARTPESYADCFLLLDSAAVIPSDLASRLMQMAKFRNLLLHLYGEVDDGRVWDMLQSRLGDLDEFLQAVGAMVRQEP